MRRRYELGGYAEWGAPPELQHVVETVWTFRQSSGEGRMAESLEEGSVSRVEGHRVLPHAGVSLCFHSLRAPGGRCRDGEVMLLGPSRSVRAFTPMPGQHIEAVRVKPEWMRCVLGIDGGRHADTLERMLALDPATDGCVLRDRLLRTRSPAEAIRELLAHLAGRMDRGVRIERSVSLAHEALERIRGADAVPCRAARTGSSLDLSGIGSELGISERQLRRVVKQETGLGPKRLQRLDRMNRAVMAADRCDRPNWSRIALDHGYCDQSHLIREVREFTGRSPVDLHRERRRQEIARSRITGGGRRPGPGVTARSAGRRRP